VNKVKKYLVVIAGPTAVGKTDIAIQLAKSYGSVIVSADSRQFYKGMDIGTAKPSEEQLAEVPHYFINTKNPDELYGAGHYEKDAIELLEDLFKKHTVVFLVGGSGLYINAVLKGVDDFIEVPSDIREELNKTFIEKGMSWLQEEVKKRDPEYSDAVDINNPQRLVRALEVCLFTGQKYSSFLNRKREPRKFDAIKILINTDRVKLYDQINRRVDDMMQAGLLEEAKKMHPFKKENALKTVGYKELYAFMDGSYDLKAAVEKIKQHTRNYAKRQLTWFKNQDQFIEFSPEELSKIRTYIDSKI
jgi:tRNA dimethylallyltransferase